MSILSDRTPSLFAVDPFIAYMVILALLVASAMLLLPGGDLPFTCADDETYHSSESRCVDHSAVEQAVVAELQAAGGRMIQDRLIAKSGLSYLDVRLTDEWSDRYYCWDGQGADYCELREEGDTR